MSKTPLRLAFVMDPLESIDVQADTTFVLMLEARQRGHEVLYVDPRDIGVAGGLPVAQVTPVTPRRDPLQAFERGETRMVVLEDEIDVVLQRKDPPVDAEYVTVTQILALCRRALVLNRPAGILAANEKLFTLNFADDPRARGGDADGPTWARVRPVTVDDEGVVRVVRDLRVAP